MQKELYFVWRGEEDGQYFEQYDSLEDAVTSNSSGVEVFKAELKSLGLFKVVTKVVKAKKGKN